MPSSYFLHPFSVPCAEEAAFSLFKETTPSIQGSKLREGKAGQYTNLCERPNIDTPRGDTATLLLGLGADDRRC